jgi:mRNA-degrading endonuclease RelE of RelBE toxin-antitoxin system
MVFYELPAFANVREDYLDDDAFKALQDALIANPDAGSIIRGTGGLRKMRWVDSRRNKGTRGGLRVIYYFKKADDQIWLFAVYDKDEADDLTPAQAKLLKARLAQQIKAKTLT